MRLTVFAMSSAWKLSERNQGVMAKLKLRAAYSAIIVMSVVSRWNHHAGRGHRHCIHTLFVLVVLETSDADLGDVVSLGVLYQLAVELLLGPLAAFGNGIGRSDERERDELGIGNRIEDGGQVAPEVGAVDFHSAKSDAIPIVVKVSVRSRAS